MLLGASKRRKFVEIQKTWNAKKIIPGPVRSPCKMNRVIAGKFFRKPRDRLLIDYICAA